MHLRCTLNRSALGLDAVVWLYAVYPAQRNISSVPCMVRVLLSWPVVRCELCVLLQVLPMVIARSPRNHALKATFQDSNTARFQDGVIQALQSIAQVVPDGMLVFMPSYGMLNKLVSHWKESRASLMPKPIPYQAIVAPCKLHALKDPFVDELGYLCFASMMRVCVCVCVLN